MHDPGAPARRSARNSSDGFATGLEPAAAHVEDADLLRRAEAVLVRAQQPERVEAVALELQHDVDEVLEHARTRDRALLGHVADQHERGAVRLRGRREQRRALAHLRDRARRRLDALAAQRLHRVDQHERRQELAPGLRERFDAGLREHHQRLG
jgi:hypothetical protein